MIVRCNAMLGGIFAQLTGHRSADAPNSCRVPPRSQLDELGILEKESPRAGRCVRQVGGPKRQPIACPSHGRAIIEFGVFVTRELPSPRRVRWFVPRTVMSAASEHDRHRDKDRNTSLHRFVPNPMHPPFRDQKRGLFYRSTARLPLRHGAGGRICRPVPASHCPTNVPAFSCEGQREADLWRWSAAMPCWADAAHASQNVLRIGTESMLTLPGRVSLRHVLPYPSRRELNRRYSSTDASISDFRMETLSTLMPIGKCFSRA